MCNFEDMLVVVRKKTDNRIKLLESKSHVPAVMRNKIDIRIFQNEASHKEENNIITYNFITDWDK